MLSEVGTQIFWVPTFFFKKFITNFRQGITKEEGDFSSKGAALPSVFEKIYLAV